MYDQLYGRTGLIAILGSGFLWAWYDALFMGSLATGAARSDFMAELVAILMFAFGALWASVLLFGARRFHGLVESARSALGTGVVGTVGSLAVVCAAATGSVPLLVAGCAAGGFFLAFGTIGWGAVYAQGGPLGQHRLHGAAEVGCHGRVGHEQEHLPPPFGASVGLMLGHVTRAADIDRVERAGRRKLGSKRRTAPSRVREGAVRSACHLAGPGKRPGAAGGYALASSVPSQRPRVMQAP